MIRWICGNLNGTVPEPDINSAEAFLKFVGRNGEPQEHYFLDDYQAYFAFKMEIEDPQRPIEFWLKGDDDKYFLAANEKGPVNDWEDYFTDEWLNDRDDSIHSFEEIGENVLWERAKLDEDGKIDWATLVD